jgi:pyruvyl transferase EpsI
MKIVNKIKQMIPVSVKARVLYHLSSSRDDRFQRYLGKRQVIVALAADYGNLGDVAITYAQEKYLKSCFPEFEVIDFPISSTFTGLKALKRVVTSEDLVTIAGGGNMGDLHYTIEDCRRFIIENFPNNKIISFPQSIDFSDKTKGRRELSKTLRVYSRHKNLHLVAREPVSYENMRKTFTKNYVYLAPDMVLSLNQMKQEQKRQGVLLCMRKDRESIFSSEERAAFITRFTSAVPDLIQKDTHIGGNGLTLQAREAELFKMWELFRRAEVVVTDRLHGMIFATITGTPCVVLQNISHKIKATYHAWLSSLSHIILQEGYDCAQTIRTVEELRKYPIINIQKPDYTDQYQSLIRALMGESR